MRAHDPHVVSVIAHERTEARLVREPELVVEGEATLEKCEAERDPRHRLHLEVTEVRVACVQNPATLRPNRDTGLTGRVTGERDQEHVVARVGERAHRFEPVPALAACLVGLPLRSVLELRLAVAPVLGAQRIELGLEHVHGRVRKVGQTAGVVDVEVGRHEVPDVALPEPERFDARDRGVRRVERWPTDEVELEAEPLRIEHVLRADAGVDEQEPVARLDHEDVAVDARFGEQATVPFD